ncbi:MAG TPA: AbrB/MazE/SpoVT family DNA-binding domain-containing protein [Gaiella sp.]|jgi:antitoxin PrlF|nr:AbrB/MazE/SpoVT family DNA-binding domain-containing protein [Gaiella sp.]
MRAILSGKGQVTIPKPLRDSLGLEPGQAIDFREEGGRLVGRKVVAEDALDAVSGILDLGKSTDELIEELRGPAELP